MHVPLLCDTSPPPPVICNRSELPQVVEEEKGSSFIPLEIIEKHHYCHPFQCKTRVNARINAKPIIDLKPL